MKTNEGEADARDGILQYLASLEVAHGETQGAIAVFPVFAAANTAGLKPLEYRTLAKVIATGSVEVTEQPAASVPELVLHNRGKVMVFVLDGEEIVGGRQNRIVNASLLVAAGTKVTLPVSCVEHGRWHETSARFSPGETSFFTLRREKAAQVNANLRAHRGHIADQGAIWSRIAGRQGGLGTASATGAMHDMYRAQDVDLGAYQRALMYPDGAVGMVVSLGGHIAGAELFDQPRTAAALWPRLIRSYALDALDAGIGDPVAQARAVEFLKKIDAASCEVFPSLALGQDVRFEGKGIVGSALVYKGVPVHVSVFATDSPGSSSVNAPRVSRLSTRRGFHTHRGQATGEEGQAQRQGPEAQAND